MTEWEKELSGMTYHLVPNEYYHAQSPDQNYLPEPMVAGRENFIHCTDGAENMAATANRHYRNDPRPFLVLLLDKSKLKSPVKYEDAGRIYPHIYGALNRDAIIEIKPMPRDADGLFLPPV